MKFREGIRDVDALRVLQIQRNSTGENYDWIRVRLYYILTYIVYMRYIILQETCVISEV